MSTQRTIVTVSELTKDIKLLLENTIGIVWVAGEVSNLRRPASGHIYFTLKDEHAQIRCVLFRREAARVAFTVRDGLSVLVCARVGVYERDGQYQLYVQSVEAKGIGSLHLAFEELKARLEKEGLFAPEYKQDLPFLPRKIGVVTSATGAVIRDILHVLEKRFSNFQVIVHPVKVQGEGAKEEIAQALHYFNAERNVDVIIVARGGGSIEDLWAFNEEVVARALFASSIPVVSAVGHETDFTIADFVSDVRAPTPSRAAELVVPDKENLYNTLNDLVEDLQKILENRIPEYRQTVDDLTQQLQDGIVDIIERKQQVVETTIVKLDALSPLRTLSRGYSATFLLPEEKSIRDARHIRVGDRIKTRFARGALTSRVEEIDV